MLQVVGTGRSGGHRRRGDPPRLGQEGSCREVPEHLPGPTISAFQQENGVILNVLPATGWVGSDCILKTRSDRELWEQIVILCPAHQRDWQWTGDL